MEVVQQFSIHPPWASNQWIRVPGSETEVIEKNLNFDEKNFQYIDDTGGSEEDMKEFWEMTDSEYASFKLKEQKVVLSDKLKLKMEQKFHELYLSIAKLKSGEYDDDFKQFKGIILDTCHACLINHCDAVDLICNSKFDYYHALLRFAVNCRLVMNLEYFEDQFTEQEADSKYFKTGGVEAFDDVGAKHIRDLAMDALEPFNRHSKVTTLKFLNTLKCNYTYGYLSKFFLTISAMDVPSGRIGTYQIALALRDRTLILGLVRDVDADKVLGVMSIGGAEGIVRADLKAVASDLAASRAKKAQTTVPAEVELNVKANHSAEELQVCRSRADKVKME